MGSKVRGVADVIAMIRPNSSVMVGGFGPSGYPGILVEALVDSGIGGLTVISNDLGSPNVGLGRLLANGQVKALIGSYYNWNPEVARAYNAREIDVRLVPQGTLAEAIRAAGAGVPAFYTPTAVDTNLESGKERRVFDGREYLLERSIHADVALIKAHKADELGNLVYRKTARNFNPVMATAADLVISQVEEVVPVGTLNPEAVITPHMFVDIIVVGGKPD